MTSAQSTLRRKVYGFAFQGVGYDDPRPEVAFVVATIWNNSASGNTIAGAAFQKARFTPTLAQVPLDQTGGLALNEVDRRCRWSSDDLGDFDAPENTMNRERKRNWTFVIENAVVSGIGNEEHVVAWTTDEDSTNGRRDAVEFADDRALADADALADVLSLDALVKGAQSDEPRILNIHRDGKSRIVSRDNGVVIAETRFVMLFRRNLLASHAP
jgi:hypothetical protein